MCIYIILASSALAACEAETPKVVPTQGSHTFRQPHTTSSEIELTGYTQYSSKEILSEVSKLVAGLSSKNEFDSSEYTPEFFGLLFESAVNFIQADPRHCAAILSNGHPSNPEW